MPLPPGLVADVHVGLEPLRAQAVQLLASVLDLEGQDQGATAVGGAVLRDLVLEPGAP